MWLDGTLDVSARSMLLHRKSLRLLRECRSSAHLRTLKTYFLETLTSLQYQVCPASDIPRGTSNFDCVEALTSLKHQVCR